MRTRSKRVPAFFQVYENDSLKEYLEDYASEETRKIGDALIEKEMDVITNPKVKDKVKEYLANIHGGERDFRF